MDATPVKKPRTYIFKESWREEFTWVEYNPDMDAIFCSVCRWYKEQANIGQLGINGTLLFLKDSHNSSMLFNKTSWLTLHDKSAQQKESKLSHAWFLGHQVGFEVMLSQSSLESRKQGQQAMKIIFDLARTMARQGLAFRGHEASGGNFHQLIQNLVRAISNSEGSPYLERWHLSSPKM